MMEEFIGMDIKAVHKKDSKMIKGKIIDETRNMLVIRTKNGDKKIIKSQYIINFLKNDFSFDGKNIIGRPEERIGKW